MHKYLVEGIGTFFLMLTIGMVVIVSRPDGTIPLAIGSALMVMIYAGGHISGAHYNPAVTLAVWMRGKVATSDVAPYMASQVVGAVLAWLAVTVMKGDAAFAAPAVIAVVPALLAELLFTFALCYVILNVATADETSGNSYFGLAIGFTVLVGAYAVGSVSGGAFNPAVAIGASLMGLLDWTNIWIYLLADFAGAALAALVFRATHPATESPAMASNESTSEAVKP